MWGGSRALGGLRSPRRGGDASSEQGMKKPGPSRASRGFTALPGLFPSQVRRPRPGFDAGNSDGWGLLEAGALDAGGAGQRPREFPFLGPSSSRPGRKGDTLGRGGWRGGAHRC